MSDPVQMQKDIEFLVSQVKQLRRERLDLLKQLSQYEEQAVESTAQQFPLAEVSRLTEGIVHDMRNGLGVIHNTVDFLADDLTNGAYEADIQKIRRGLEFCELVLRNLALLGGYEVLDARPINLETVVREVFSMLERKLVEVNLVLEVAPDAAKMVADEGQMKQVFMNLIKNAGEAMPNGGTLTCRIWRDNEMVVIQVQDTGVGISAENQERLFRDFFTTKPRGYGLGLHIVQSIVKRHQGTIAVESILNGGTTFTLYLPIEAE